MKIKGNAKREMAKNQEGNKRFRNVAQREHGRKIRARGARKMKVVVEAWLLSLPTHKEDKETTGKACRTWRYAVFHNRAISKLFQVSA
jgi:hypothetical protein